MTPRQRRQLGVLVGLTLLLPVMGGPAAADPLQEKKAEAARIQRQLEEDGTRLSVNTERFNQAQLRFERVRAQMVKAQQDLARGDERMKVVRGRLAQAAVVAYVHGGSNTLLSHLARSGENDFVVRRQYLRITAADQRRVIGELRLARLDLDALRARLASDERAADAAAKDAAAAKRAALDAEADQRAVLGRINGELVGLVAAEEARRQAQAAPSGAAPAAARGPAGPAPAAPKKGAEPKPGPAASPPPPVGRGAEAAVAEAKRQIGKPYVYGGSGPNSFDCSGLTAWAWRAGGVSLSHSARAQYHETTRVPVDAVQPGDLLFFGPSVSGIHHNAIYVGGGQMVEASQTGVPVRYRGWRAKDLVGVGRPG